MAAAQQFALEFGVARLHDSYEALAADPTVDAIYIATPHTYHCANTLLCLQAGKAVLCEKPFAINLGEAEQMVSEARSRRLFLMEAMWSRFLPALVEVRRLLADGAIGRPRMLTADFGFRTEVNPQSRLFDPHLGGGALLDVGIYPLSLAWMIFGAPASIQAQAHVGSTGVDERTGVLLGYDAGELALLSCAVTTDTPQEAVILGAAADGQKGANHRPALYRQRLQPRGHGSGRLRTRRQAGERRHAAG
jgi:predicted dehydrogenase